MQLKKLSPIAASLLLASLLSACGGGKGDDEAPAPAAAAPGVTAVTASPASVNSASQSVEDKPMTFDGGACGGGTAPYTTTWNFGDSTATSSANTHIYADPGTYPVTVTCTDSKNVSKTSTALSLVVKSEAWGGFLGRSWSTYATIDPANGYIYPVAGIANSGDIYGVWLRSNVDNVGHFTHITDVAAGSSNFSATTWTMATPDPQLGTLGAMPTFDGTGFNPVTAALDMAVSPNGKAIAAWRTVSSTTGNSSLWIATKDVTGSWSTPALVNVLVGAEVAAATSVNDATIKVVVNDNGDGAIAYCTGAPATSTARVVVYSNTSHTAALPVDISKRCDTTVSISDTQKTRSFDIAIDGDSKVTAVGLTASTTAGNFYVSRKSIPLVGLTTSENLSEELTPAKMPSSDFSLSYAISPDGKVAAVAWTQVGTPVAPNLQIDKINVLAKVYSGGSGGSWAPVAGGTPVTPLTTFEFIRPLIAVNDKGQAFLAMEGDTPSDGTPYFKRAYRTYVSNYAAATGWGTVVITDTDANPATDYRFNATDIAIDKYGTGLITRSNGYQTSAGTLSAASAWSGFTSITSGYTAFHYQTMRAMPDGTGRAILVTSVRNTSGFLSSGYVLLK